MAAFDFGDEMAEKLVDVGKAALAAGGSAAWRIAKKLTGAAYKKIHERNASLSGEMADVQNEVDDIMSSPLFEDGRVYDVGTGATLVKSGGIVTITYDFTDNLLPDGSKIDDLKGAEKDIIAQLRANGAPEFGFEIEEGLGRLWFNAKDQPAMSAALKQTKLSFASILEGAKEKIVEPVSLEGVAQEFLANHGDAREITDLSEEEIKDLFEGAEFTAAASKHADSIRCDYKACGVDVRARYVPRERQVVIEYAPESKDAFEGAKERIREARTLSAREKESEARRRAAETRRAGKESLESRAARVEGSGRKDKPSLDVTKPRFLRNGPDAGKRDRR